MKTPATTYASGTAATERGGAPAARLLADAPTVAGRRAGPLARVRNVLIGTIVPVAVIAIWWIVTGTGMYPDSVLPSPAQVAEAMWTWYFGAAGTDPYSGTGFDAVAASAGRVFAGYAVAAVVGIAMGVLIGYFRLFGQLFDPLVQVLRPIPVTAWVPLSLVFFGFSFQGKVFLIGLGAFFPVVINTTEGVRGVSRTLVRAGRMMGASTLSLLRHIIVPAAAPSIFVGLRIGMGVAWLLVVVAELLAVGVGIGSTLQDAYSVGQYQYIISAMITLGVLGFASDCVIVAIQRLVLRWHREMSVHGD